jgi:GAF domain-containing protein
VAVQEVEKITASTDDMDPRWKLVTAARDRLAHAQGLDEIVDIVRTAARAALSADGVTVVLRDGDQCHYVDEDAIMPLFKGQRFPLSICISGWSMLNRQTAAIEDIYADPRIPHDVYRRTFVKSLSMVPAGKAAAIGAYWRDQRNFSSREIALVEALAQAVGEAMDKAA